MSQATDNAIDTMRAGIISVSIARPLVVAGGALAAALLGAGVWGWAKYGTAVFFEMVASGIASCF
ncbi:MAG TPA: hypothetical protein VFQ27_02050 [Xanthobacteraceae bacterium]|nr:hypothetical protein [Xanthobacteraceae bacterium]